MLQQHQVSYDDHQLAFNDWWKPGLDPTFSKLQVQGVYECRAKSEVDFILEKLKPESGASFVDVPTGGGRHAIELALRGYKVTGVDCNFKVLNHARIKAREKGVRVIFHESDMRTFDTRQRYDYALNLWGSFGYFSDEENIKFLQHVSDVLKPGGGFVLEVMTTESLMANFKQRNWGEMPLENGACKLLDEREFDLATSRLEIDWTYFLDGEKTSAHSSYRIYTLHELLGLLKEVGFSRIEAYDEYDNKPYYVGSRRACIFAWKGE